MQNKSRQIVLFIQKIVILNHFAPLQTVFYWEKKSKFPMF